MEKYDANQIDDAALFERRKQAVRLYRSGKCRGYAEIGSIVGAHPITVGKWIRGYLKGGLRALTVGRRGRPVGLGRRLLPHEETQIRRDLVDKCPDQLKLPFALWTRQAVKLHIKVCFGLDVPIRTVGDYLKRWGFTPQKPIKKAYQRNEEHVQRWLTEEFPKIKQQAKAEGADIFWGDETGIRNDEVKGRSYAPKGKTPVQKVNPVREKINMISAITNQGKIHFMFYRETMTAQLLIEFLERLIRHHERKVFLILDNLRVHHSKTLNAFLSENAAFIRIFFLPSYSPDLNPDEYLNRDLKSNLNNKPLGRARGKLEEHAKEHMEMVAQQAERIKKLFNAETVKYAS
jgi:transposase